MMERRNEFPSQTIGSVHIALLGICLSLDLLVAFFTVFYVFNFELYWNHFSDIDQLVSTFSFVLYLIVIVTFFTWLVRVHAALRKVYSDYPIKAFGGVVRMIPPISIWGLYDTFATIGSYLSRNPSLVKDGDYVRSMIAPLYIALFVSSVINRLLLRDAVEAADWLFLVGALVDLGMMVIFFFVSRRIHRAVSRLCAENAGPASVANSGAALETLPASALTQVAPDDTATRSATP